MMTYLSWQYVSSSDKVGCQHGNGDRGKHHEPIDQPQSQQDRFYIKCRKSPNFFQSGRQALLIPSPIIPPPCRETQPLSRITSFPAVSHLSSFLLCRSSQGTQTPSGLARRLNHTKIPWDRQDLSHHAYSGIPLSREGEGSGLRS